MNSRIAYKIAHRVLRLMRKNREDWRLAEYESALDALPAGAETAARAIMNHRRDGFWY